MPVASTRDLIDAARAAGTAVGAFNVVGLEHAEAVVGGADAAGAPVILQVSENAVRFRSGQVAPLAAACLALAEAASRPVALHLDHASDLALCQRAAAAGFSSVMFDAAADDYAANVAATREVAAWASAAGVWLEAELGEIGGKEGARDGDRTDPDEARAYVAETGVDGLAVAVGSRHKMVDATASLDLPLIAALRAAVPAALVLHGSSGVPDATLRQAVSHGIVKVNVGTRLSSAFTDAVRATLAADAGPVDPRTYLAAARSAMTAVVTDTVRALSA